MLLLEELGPLIVADDANNGAGTTVLCCCEWLLPLPTQTPRSDELAEACRLVVLPLLPL